MIQTPPDDMAIRPGIDVAGLSDVGCQRENNEDRYSYWEPSSEEEFLRKGRLALIADGMGGYEGGQEASRAAVETIEQVYAASSGSPSPALLDAFHAAHSRIQELASHTPSLRGMGTTCTAVVVLGYDLFYAHVGDSRLYLARDSKIYRLTRDHSYVGRLVEEGIVSAEEAESHPQRHILTAALGAGSEITPEATEQPIQLESGDELVLCTDGLWGQVNDKEIEDAVSNLPPENACRKLVQLAKDRGGPDNITVEILRVS
jgi:PPM family protein phosphatase